MKKLRYFLAIVFLLVISTACGQEEELPASSIASVNDVISSQMALNDSDSSNDDTNGAQSDASESASSSVEDTNQIEVSDALIADVDLTELSATMVYAEMYNMVTMPMVYHGKTIKVTGYYDEYYDVMTNTLYCSIFVMDALACCAQGLSVEFDADYSYPDEYPEDGAEITIYATFEIYYPDPSSSVYYYHLVDAEILS